VCRAQATTAAGGDKMKLAQQLMKDKKYGKAADILSEVLQSEVEKNGDFSEAAGPIYSAYGQALLQKARSSQRYRGRDMYIYILLYKYMHM
jgi:hypothetical protein